MIVVVFDNELKAYDGSKALNDLDAEESISTHSEAVVEKKTDGKLDIKDEGNDFPIRTVGGTAIGALIGLLGGPIGVGIDAVAGTFTGLFLGMDRAGVNAEFLDDFSNKLTPGEWAVVADISEDWETPLDTRMAALGGTVFRTARRDYVRDQDAKYIAAIKAHIAQLKEEQSKSKAEHKAKIQANIDSLDKKLNTKLGQAKKQSEQREQEAKAKIEALEKKRSKAKGEANAKIESRIAEIKERERKENEAFHRWWTEK